MESFHATILPIALPILVGSVVLACRLSRAKNRSAIWNLLTLCFCPTVLILGLLPALPAEAAPIPHEPVGKQIINGSPYILV